MMAVAADTLAQDLFAPRRRAAASLALWSHTVEALLVLHPTLSPEEALRLAGLAGGGEADALRVAQCMSGTDWDARLLRVLCGVLRLLKPPAPGSRVKVRPSVPVDVTAGNCGDPPPGRSALDRRVAVPVPESTDGSCAHG